MSAVTVSVAGQAWRFDAEPAMPRGARFQVIAMARLVDELTDEPPRVGAAVRSLVPGLTARSSSDGAVGLVGRPAALFPTPWPATAPLVGFTVSAPGFLDATIAGALPAQPTFPHAFAPTDFGRVALHRVPTTISGVAIDDAGGDVSAAAVAVTAIWTTQSALAAPGPGAAPNGISLLTPLAADRPVGATVRERALTPLPGAKTLLTSASVGTTRLRLSDRQSLAAGMPVVIADGDLERAEYGTIAAIDPMPSVNQPGWITLDYPLSHAQFEGVSVAPATLGAPGAANTLTSAARAGDQSLLTSGLAGLSPGQLTVEITGGGAPPEYRAFSLWRATTASTGAFRLPPLHRLAHVELTASGGGQPTPVRRIVSLSGAPTALADMVFA